MMLTNVFFLLFSYNWKFELLIWMTLISLLVERSKFGYRKLSYACIVYILQLMQFCHNFYIVSRWKISPLHVYGHSHLHKLNAECAFIYIYIYVVLILLKLARANSKQIAFCYDYLKYILKDWCYSIINVKISINFMWWTEYSFSRLFALCIKNWGWNRIHL